MKLQIFPLLIALSFCVAGCAPYIPTIIQSVSTDSAESTLKSSSIYIEHDGTFGNYIVWISDNSRDLKDLKLVSAKFTDDDGEHIPWDLVPEPCMFNGCSNKNSAIKEKIHSVSFYCCYVSQAFSKNSSELTRQDNSHPPVSHSFPSEFCVDIIFDLDGQNYEIKGKLSKHNHLHNLWNDLQ